MVIPFFAFMLAMAASSQFPPWGPPNPYVYPGYYSAPAWEVLPPGQLFGKADHKHHKVHKAHHAHK